ncbi:MAG TPA: PPC domain-containing protein, partial [Urbifossiella sp.]
MNRILAFCFSWLLCAQVNAASPSLGSIQPRGAQRGTDAVVTFNGGRLADAQEILIYYPGVSVKKLEVVNDAQLKVTFGIAADCRLGEHAFRVRTASGISDLRTFWVGALPTIDEKEPNSDFDKPQPIALNSTVHGIVDSEDQDYFVVECKKGQRLSAEVEGMRLGITVFDPYVAILDAKRFELATSDDSPLIGQDCGCSIVVPADGKYLVQIRESAYAGNGACQYRLHIGNFPRPTAVVPAGGKPNEELEVTFLGDPSGPIKQKVKLPASMSDPYWRLHCQTADGIMPSGFKFHIVDVPNVLESATNNTAATAVVGPAAPCAFNGVIAKPGESDYFKFTAKKGQVFDVRCLARQIGSPLDSVMYFGRADGAAITGNDDSGGPDSYFRISIPEDNTYTIWLQDHLKKGGPDYFYRIELTAVQASVGTTIPKVDGNNPSNQDRQAITVPKGNRFATLLVGNRAEFGGPLAMSLGQLPPGVTMNAEAMDPGLNVVPVVFEAAPTAAIGGMLTPINAKPADPKVIVPSLTSFDASFAIGQPGQTVYSRHVVEKAAFAVTDAAPF